MKIVITDFATVSQGGLDLSPLNAFQPITVYQETALEETALRVAEADVILCNKTLLNAETLAQASHLQYIGLFATGYNNIDLEYADQKGITVCNAGSYSTDAVAQHTFALLLELAGKVGQYHQFVEQGGWIRSTTFSPFVYPTVELAGKTMGLIGYGSIGKAVANIALAFGMKVLVHTRTPGQDNNVTFVDFDTLLAQSDIISLHCPLTRDNAGMFDAAAFAKCKQGALFLNTARGPLVQEEALREALESDQLAGAGLDVLSVEPMSPDCPLLHAKNLLITPHVAWSPLETRQRLLQIAADNLTAFLAGAPTHVVNHPLK